MGGKVGSPSKESTISAIAAVVSTSPSFPVVTSMITLLVVEIKLPSSALRWAA